MVTISRTPGAPGASDASGRSDRGIRRRPKDRKEQIARAAAEAFSAQGYHAVGMEDIAARVGISAPALYRHYPSKYDLFAGVVLALGRQLVDCIDFVDTTPGDGPAADPAAVLDRVIAALIGMTLAHRESGGLYRWQIRYLESRDRATLADQLELVNRRIQRPLLAVRPSLTPAERRMLSTGLLSVIGSVVDHRIQPAADDMDSALTGAASALLTAQLPKPGDDVAGRAPVWRIFASDAGAYEALLHGAMALFGDQGYAATSMTQIAEAAGIPVSGIYRYFSGKCEILATGLRRAADRVSGEVSAIAGVFTEPRQVLTRLIDAYVAMSFADPHLAAVYYTDFANLAPTDQEVLHNLQRSTVDAWVRLLVSARPELGAAQARVLVRAAMALVVDLDRLDRHVRATGAGQIAADSAHLQACVRKMMQRTLFWSSE